MAASVPEDQSEIKQLQDMVKKLESTIRKQKATLFKLEREVLECKGQNRRLEVLLKKNKVRGNRIAGWTSIPHKKFQRSGAFTPGSPEQALADYMWAWRTQDWEQLSAFTQTKPDWPTSQYIAEHLCGFKIIDSRKHGPDGAEITCIVVTDIVRCHIQKSQYTIRMNLNKNGWRIPDRGDWDYKGIKSIDKIEGDWELGGIVDSLMAERARR
jgi:hypothetical protein